MKISFHKYHGAGNDFILIDNRNLHWSPSAQQISVICHRHFGIGADGLMLIEAHEGFDFGMRYFNSDGKEGSMCGNGGRCITAFAGRIGLIDKSTRFMAIDGEHQATILYEEGPVAMVRLKMRDSGIPKLSDEGYMIDTGSPHLVVFREDAESIDVIGEGRKLRYNDHFLPDGINVNFLDTKVDGPFLRTYERGVEDETLSCGTGATAAALVLGFINERFREAISIKTRGGILKVSYQFDGTIFRDIWLEGPAELVFAGGLNLD